MVRARLPTDWSRTAVGCPPGAFGLANSCRCSRNRAPAACCRAEQSRLLALAIAASPNNWWLGRHPIFCRRLPLERRCERRSRRPSPPLPLEIPAVACANSCPLSLVVRPARESWLEACRIVYSRQTPATALAAAAMAERLVGEL